MDSATEYQYSPSLWSKRFQRLKNSDAVVQDHISIVSKVSQNTKDTVPYSENIRYGPGANQLLDIFGTDLPSESPILVYIHGGYWQALDKSISSYPVIPLYKEGIKVAIAGYDLAPKVSLAQIIKEMNDLWNFLTTLALEENVKGIWFSGHSAGAHLASTILNVWLTEPCNKKKQIMKGMILISGVFDLSDLIKTSVNDALKLNRDEATFFSPILTLKNVKYDGKILIAVGEHDSEVFKRQSKIFCQNLRKGGTLAEYFLVTKKDHFDIVEDLSFGSDALTLKVIDLILNFS